jgi:hypothetical protein
MTSYSRHVGQIFGSLEFSESPYQNVPLVKNGTFVQSVPQKPFFVLNLPHYD